MDQKGVSVENFHELIRMTAHDVRTPLTSISGFAEMLAEDESLSSGARENAEVIMAEAKRLAETLEVFFSEIARKPEEAAAASPDEL